MLPSVALLLSLVTKLQKPRPAHLPPPSPLNSGAFWTEIPDRDLTYSSHLYTAMACPRRRPRNACSM